MMEPDSVCSLGFLAVCLLFVERRKIHKRSIRCILPALKVIRSLFSHLSVRQATGHRNRTTSTGKKNGDLSTPINCGCLPRLGKLGKQEARREEEIFEMVVHRVCLLGICGEHAGTRVRF
ncbi:hypothetical protein WA026_001200 [Henosepilachna vigintioctopunctata]|uniref:Secreted protein n=1 Tax=Henosepilachna vigintioctopunctata TaxID=420089 RepID=A0AAW1UH69_9CUCU